MRTLKIILSALFIISGICGNAQTVQPYRFGDNSFTQQVNIGVGTVRSTNASAYLEVGPSSNGNKGLLLPRLTGTQRDAIASPASGLTIYNTSTNQINYYNGTAWSSPLGGNFVDSVKSSNDSLYYYIAGTAYFIKKVQPYGSYLTSIPGIDDVLSVGQSLTANRTANGAGFNFNLYSASGNILFNTKANSTSYGSRLYLNGDSAWYIGNNKAYVKTNGVGNKLHIVAGQTSSDTTTYKPLAAQSSDGETVLMTYWPGGGSSGLTIGTTTIANSVSGSVLYDSSGILSRNDDFYWSRTAKQFRIGGTLAESPSIKFTSTDNAFSTDYSIVRNANSGNNPRGLQFYNDGTGSVMELTRNGRVGILTDNPQATLDVRGSVIINDDGGDNDTRMEGDTDPNLFFVDASTDRVGIGTNTPSAKLEVIGQSFFIDNTINATVNYQNTSLSGYAAFDFYNSSSVKVGTFAFSNASAEAFPNDLWFGTRNGGDIRIITGSSPDTKLIIKNGGNIGIGTNAPGAKLHVSGTTKFDLGSDATGDIFYRDASGFFTRLPIGGAGQHLVGGTTPHWVDTSAGGGGYTNLTQFVGQNNWKVFYSDGSGDVQELAIGTSGKVLTSNGATSVPSWEAPITYFNANVGSGYRWAIPNTNNIKTATAGVGIEIDSAVSNQNDIAIVGYDEWLNNTVTTSDATVTTLATITPTDNSRGTLEVTLIGVKPTDAAYGISGKKFIHWKKVSGTVTVSQIVGEAADYLETFTTATWTVDASGGTLRIRVTGEAATTVEWQSVHKLKYSLYSL